MAQQPPYAPNTVNQTVDYGGATWKGDPGSGWHLASTDTRHGAYAGSGGASDMASLAAQTLKLYQEANAPAVKSLEESIPLVGQQTAQTSAQLKSSQTTLESRYNTLLDQIKGNQAKEETRTGTETSRELGRRGISSQSGLWDQTINKALSPISQYYTNQIASTGNTFQDALMSIFNQQNALPLQQAQEENKIKQAIASLMAGGNSSAITTALDMWKQQQANQQSEANRALQLQIAQMEETGNKNDPYGLFS